MPGISSPWELPEQKRITLERIKSPQNDHPLVALGVLRPVVRRDGITSMDTQGSLPVPTEGEERTRELPTLRGASEYLFHRDMKMIALFVQRLGRVDVLTC